MFATSDLSFDINLQHKAYICSAMMKPQPRAISSDHHRLRTEVSLFMGNTSRPNKYFRNVICSGDPTMQFTFIWCEFLPRGLDTIGAAFFLLRIYCVFSPLKRLTRRKREEVERIWKQMRDKQHENKLIWTCDFIKDAFGVE